MFLAYRFLTTLIFPFLVVVIFFRKLIKKEDAKRYKEKILLKKIDYNFEKPVWFHGASIGEIKSIIPIIKYLTNKYSKMKILITSVTLSSGKIIEKEFKDFENIHHQYFPLDVPFLANKFLKNWKPKLVVFIDSEIWPNFLFEIKKKNINLILLNARITKKTFSRWKFLKRFSTELFSAFNICLAASKDSYYNLLGLGATNVKFIGNLKYFSDKENKIIINNKLSDQFNNYRVWCAASTHKGEDEICIQAHKEIKKKYNNVLTIIIPRHIERINNIYKLCKNHNLQTQILTGEDILEKKVEIILINTFGDLLKYYNYCNSVFIGKSLITSLKSVGGQSPLEAAYQGCKIYHGPYIYNFKEVYSYLQEAKISRSINNSKELSENIIKDFKDIKDKNFNEIKKLKLYGKNIFKKTMIELEKFIQQ